MIVGIDASRNHSWGAIVHIVGILNNFDSNKNEIRFIHIWTHDHLAKLIPERPWLKVHTPRELRKSLFSQIVWQALVLPKLLKSNNCDLLFTSDAGSFCRFFPNVVLSQDLLPFETGEAKRLGWGLARWRVLALRFVQASAMKRAVGIIFLTEYASDLITSKLNLKSFSKVIQHGIDEEFKSHQNSFQRNPNMLAQGQINCVYVSNVDEYKHQWHVVEAIAFMRGKGYDVNLTLIGDNSNHSSGRLGKAILEHDPEGNFVDLKGHLTRDELRNELCSKEIFIFASSCESLPITLLEGMAFGFPIAASRKGPMPELLGSDACYFDPEIPEDIAKALIDLITDKKFAKTCASAVMKKSKLYHWKICAEQTFSFLSEIGKNYK